MPLIMDKQRADFFKLIKQDIPALFDKMSVDNDLVHIQFKPVDFDYSNPKVNNRYTKFNTVKTEVFIENKATKEQRNFLINLLNIPVYTQVGYIINGNQMQILDLYKRSSGWYVLEGKKGITTRTLELLPRHGKKLIFELSNVNNITYIAATTFDSNKKISIAAFLKAITGKSYLELANLLGMSNEYVTTTFSTEDEPSREDCINVTLNLFRNKSTHTLGTDKKLLEINKHLFEENYLSFGTEAKERFKRNSSFAIRALNKVLAEDIVVYGETIKAGTTLYQNILDNIDSADLDTLKVFHDSKIFELKKYKSSDSFDLNEILTAFNMFACALDGYDKIDSQYELTNRCAKPFSQSVLEALQSAIANITAQLLEKLLYIDEKSLPNLIEVTSAITPYAVNSFLDNDIEATSKEVQSSDTNNIVSFVSKSFKITTDYGGVSAPEEMIRVQDAQSTRLDPIDSPESKKIGLVHTKTLFADIDSSGFLVTPYIPIENGKVISEEPVYLTAVQEQNKYIAEWNETFENDRVKARYNGSIVSVLKNKVTYKEYTPLQSMSPARAQIPFQNHSNPKRLLMGSNHQKQTILTLNTERPIVGTGAECLLKVGYFTAQDVLELYLDENIGLVSEAEREDFLKCSLLLIGSREGDGYRELDFNVSFNNKILAPSLAIPFLQKTTGSSIRTYRVNVQPGNLYQGDDIVAFDAGFDIKKYNVEKLIDYGSYKVPDSTFDKGIALGNNIIVGFKTWEGSTIDDAMVVSSELVGTDKLTSVTLKCIHCELNKTKDTAEVFGFIDEKTREPHMQTNGLPIVGTYLKAGSLAIAKYSGKLAYDDNTRQLIGRKNKSIYVDNSEEGEVVRAEIKGNEAIVTLASISQIEVGDKEAGRYGNKGVVAKIVPEQYMPYDPVTGLKLQVILNPLGVPSRMNISQVLEVVLAFSAKKQGKIVVISPYNDIGLDYVKQQAELTNTKPMLLRDGRTGQMFKRPMNVGIMYMLKLEHRVGKKVHAINAPTNIDPTFMQPKKGKKMNGGQAFGEMEEWCLQAIGARKVLQDIVSIQSDDVLSRSPINSLITSNPLEFDYDNGQNNNDHLSQAFFRSLCAELQTDKVENSYKFVPMTDKLIMGLAPRGLDTKNANSLHDPTIFGPSDTKRSSVCCKNRVRWGWVDLGAEIVHPFWIRYSKLGNIIIVDHLVKKDNNESAYVTGPIKSDKLKKLAEEKVFVKFMHDGVVVSDYKSDGFITGIGAVVELLKTSTYTAAENYYNQALETCWNDDDALMYKKTLNSIKELKANGIEFTDFIISKFPIMPQNFRPELKDRGKNTVQDFDRYYQYIFTAINAYKSDKSPVSLQKIYTRILEFSGLDSKLNDASKYKSLLTWFTGKDEKNNDNRGKIRDNILSKRMLYSGRSVIIPSRNTKMLPTQLGVPLVMCLSMWEQHLISLFSKKLSQFSESTNWKAILTAIGSKNKRKLEELICKYSDFDRSEVESVYRTMRSLIDNFVSTQVVLCGRQPSLHKFSIRAYIPIVVDGKAIEIHPLVCKGYNADFDGDQMWLIALLTKAAKEEALRLMSPKCGVINPKDSSVILEHSQDMRLGLYFATMLHDNVTDVTKHKRYDDIRCYTSLQLMKDDIDCSIIEPQDLVCININGKKYISTAGRIWFNSIFDDGFTSNKFTNVLKLDVEKYGINPERYYELKYDGLLASKKGNKDGLAYLSMPSITEDIYLEKGSSVVENEYQKIMEFGLYFSDMSAISLTLDDLIEHSQTQSYIDKAESLAKRVEDDYYAGLMTEESRKTTLISIYTKAKELLQDVFIKEFDRNNNLFIMMDSGARGSAGQLMQTCGIVGVMSKTNTESLETPVLSNYTKGLTSFETVLASYGTRMGVSARQNETADAGYSTRQAVYMTNGFKIVEHSCGKEDWHFDVEYEEPISLLCGNNLYSLEKNVEEVRRFLVGKHLSDTCKEGIQLLGAKLGTDKFITEECATLLAKSNMNYISCLEGIANLSCNKSDLHNFLLGKHVTSDEEEVNKLLLNFLPLDKSLNEKSIELLLKHTIKKFKCSEGFVVIRYRISKLMRSMLFNREARNLPKLREGKYITQSTIDAIELDNPDSIEVLTMLNCESEGGVCARCYGLDYDTFKLPEVGQIVGIESAQALGEPAAQLTMNVVNNGGSAGTSLSSGVVIFKSLLGGNLPKDDLKAFVADSDGYVNINTLGNSCILEIGEQKYKTRRELLLVTDGEWVKLGQPLTRGYVVPDSVGPKRVTPEIVRKRQLVLMHLYFDTFVQNKIDLNARHFEVLVRLQTSLVTVLESNNPKFKAGCIAELSAVEKARRNGDIVDYKYRVAKQKEVIKHYSGMLTLLSYQDIPTSLAEAVLNQEVSKNESDIGSVLIGRDVTSPFVKELKTPDFTIDYSRDEEESDDDNENSESKLEEIVTTNLTKISFEDDIFKELSINNFEIQEEIDIDLELDSEFTEPTISEDKSHINTEADKTDKIPSNQMDMF